MAARPGKSASSSQRSLWKSCGVEERLRLGGVDEHRDVEARRRLPDRIELGVVDLQARAVGLLDVQAEGLGDLADADRAGGDVGLELLDGPLGPARADLRKSMPQSTRKRSLCGLAAMAASVALSRSPDEVVGADQDLDVEAVHRRDDARRCPRARSTGRRGWPWMSMTGNFAFGTRCCAVTSVDCRAGSRRCSAPAATAPGSCRAGPRSCRRGTRRWRRSASRRAPGPWPASSAPPRGNRKEQRDHQGSLRHRA